jgi:poly(A) polymerase
MRYRYSAGEDGKMIKKAAIYTQDEHKINNADVDNDAVIIVKKLKAAGFETYIVGGAVRDLIIGKKPKDFDVASQASPARIKRIFHNARTIGRRFRLVHVYFGKKIVEVSTFRSLKDGHTSNTFGTIEEDVRRRDFSMNALYYDPVSQIIVDYIGGMEDIKNKLIKPVIPYETIFTDDPVRMIRAVKYAAATGFSLPINLKWKIKKQAHLLSLISPSRLTEEIFKILRSDKVSEIVEALHKAGLYEYLQPQAAKLMRNNAEYRQHYLKRMTELNSAGLGALFFDYIETLADWEKPIAEHYRFLFKAARTFVLPMNPPRFELEHSLRAFFAQHNIIVKKSHFLEKPKPLEAGKKRRRRKKKPAEISH